MRGHLLRVSHATSLAVAGAASGRERATHPILAYLSAVTNNDSSSEMKSVRAKTKVAPPQASLNNLQQAGSYDLCPSSCLSSCGFEVDASLVALDSPQKQQGEQGGEGDREVQENSLLGTCLLPSRLCSCVLCECGRLLLSSPCSLSVTAHGQKLDASVPSSSHSTLPRLSSFGSKIF